MSDFLHNFTPKFGESHWDTDTGAQASCQSKVFKLGMLIQHLM